VSILYFELSINIFVLIAENKVKMANSTKLNLKLGAPCQMLKLLQSRYSIKFWTEF
jgi:hypothetical protein